MKNNFPLIAGYDLWYRSRSWSRSGKVKAIVGQFLVLEDAAWIADTGRFMEAIMEGKLNEVEPVSVDMFININSITDAFVWKHDLPRKQK